MADTNNHRVVAIDVATGMSSVFEVAGLQPPAGSVRRPLPDLKSVIEVPAVRLAATEALQTVVKLKIPAGWKRNPEFPVTWAVFSEGEQSVVPGAVLGVRREGTVAADGSQVEFAVPLGGQPGEAKLILQVTWGYCTSDDSGLCRLASAIWRVPVILNTDGGESRLELQFPEPDVQ